MFFTALLGGLLSFISPCVLPLIPIYISYISGVAIGDLKANKDVNIYKKAFLNALFFVLGFSLIFTLLGAAAHSVAVVLIANKALIAKFSGILVVLFGIFFIVEVLAQEDGKLSKIFAVFKSNIGKSYNFNAFFNKITHNKTGRLITSFVIGMAFAFGWSPCVGPVLASILTMAFNTNTVYQAMLLLFVYSIGLGLPFLFASLFMGLFLKTFAVFKTKIVSYTIGIFLIVIGIVMFLHGALPTV